MNSKKKAKIYNIFAAVFVFIMLVCIICVIVFNAMGWFTQGGGDVIVMFVPVFILSGALAALCKSKSKEAVKPPIELTASEKRLKLFLRIIVLIPTTIFVVGLLAFIISEIVYSLTH